MPKMKTRKSAAKRYTPVGNGKFKRQRGNLRHLLANKAKDAKKRNGKTDYVSRSESEKVRRMLPYSARLSKK